MNRSAIEHAIRLAGLTIPEGLEYEIEGEDPIMRSPHYLGNGAAVARLLTGIAANELWRVRTGRRQQIRVNARHAASALRSFAHLELLEPDRQPVDERPRRGPRVGGILPTRDGRHIQLHGSFNDGPQIIEELGLNDSASAEDLAAAVMERDAFELEASFVRRKVCGGVVMTKEEWAEHPQGRAIAGLPVTRITRIGDAPPQPLPDGDRPASGVRVLDLTRVLAGPTCAKTFAEHGADVLHITAPHLGGMGPFDIETGVGKRQASIDLNVSAEAELLRDLAREADVFSQGYRLGTLARRGLGPVELAELRPGIVYVAENCYGHVGPWAERPGWEQLGQAATGMSYREGVASTAGVPRLAPGAVNDYSTGFFAAYGAMIALAKRATEGGSWLVEVSLSQTCSWYQQLGDDNDEHGADIGDTSPFIGEMDTPDFGPIRYLKPALSMSETDPRWVLPPALHGSHEAAWVPR